MSSDGHHTDVATRDAVTLAISQVGGFCVGIDADRVDSISDREATATEVIDVRLLLGLPPEQAVLRGARRMVRVHASPRPYALLLGTRVWLEEELTAGRQPLPALVEGLQRIAGIAALTRVTDGFCFVLDPDRAAAAYTETLDAAGVETDTTE